MASRMLSRARFNYDEPTENDVKRVREVFEKSRRFAHARIELQVRQRVAKEMQRTPAA